MVVNGRGAWTSTGGLYGKLYQLAPAGVAQVGEAAAVNPNLDLAFNDFRAVNAGVKAIQDAAASLGVAKNITLDGWLGPQTDRAIRALQTLFGLEVDGQFGPLSAKAVFGRILKSAEATAGIPGHYLCGIAMQESLLDPGAVGYSTPQDKGLVQINLAVHDVTPGQAFDPYYAATWGAARFMEAWKHFAGKGATLQADCAVLQHNNPAAAQNLYDTGEWPSDAARLYVSHVMQYAKGFG